MSSPLPADGPWLPLYAVLAGFMVGGNLFVVLRLFPRDGTRPTLATGILLLGLLLMSMGLWFSGIYAVLSPGDASTVSVFIAVNSMMAVAGIWAISLLFRAGLRSLPARGAVWPLGFALLLVGNELLMGLTFVLALAGPARYSALGWVGLGAVLGDAATSVWFFWAMLGTMAALITWLPLTRPERTVLYGFAAASAVGPWVVPDPVVGAFGTGALMAGTFGLVAREFWKRPAPPFRFAWVGFGVAAGYLAMAVGEGASYLLQRTAWAPVPFGLISFLVMLVELFVLARWGLGTGAGPTAPAPAPRPSNPPASPSTLPP